MSDESGGWDAPREAARAFAKTEHVRAVLFCSDVAVVRRAERGPARRQHDNMLKRIRDFIRDGNEQEARDAISNCKWRGPQTIWWTTSVPELTRVIEHHDDKIRERKIAAGVSVEESLDDLGIVYFYLWWDR